MDPDSDEFDEEGNYDPDPSWNEPVQTEDYDQAWIPTNSPRTTTPASPLLPLPDIRTTTTESGWRKTSTDPVPPVRSTQYGPVRSHSDETARRGTSTRPPEVTESTKTKGDADFSGNAPVYATTTAKDAFISTSSTPVYSSAKTGGAPRGVTPKDSYEKGSFGTTTPSFTSTKTKSAISSVSSTTTSLRSRTSDVSSTTSSSFIQAEVDRGLGRPLKEDTTTADGGASAGQEIQPSTTQPSSSSEAVKPRRPASPSMPHFSSTTPSVRLSGVLLQTTQPLSNATASAVTDLWFSASDEISTLQSSALPPSPTASPFTPTPEGNVLDASSSASGSALFPDSQEGVDQEWDRVQTSASGESASPYSTTNPPSATSESGQSPDDLDERSSAFYFESESGSAMASEVGGASTPIIPAVTSATPWSLGGEEESGSGQGESLYDNETSSDFSLSERTERESEEEEPVAGKNAVRLGEKTASHLRSGRVLDIRKMTNPPSVNKSAFHLFSFFSVKAIKFMHAKLSATKQDPKTPMNHHFLHRH
ncbi:uncharacterized protein DDB_G0271670-like [Plectropomus leopardus]|uniref:uncharacterized protein DDB_G0271670-like n=1 Tax=Plectropomus leopardus TaxID=160734 RepID=UPI001C4AE878|nr:uncharacterized protein DDB_G0271670-like [Plectropomus leopardus]